MSTGAELLSREDLPAAAQAPPQSDAGELPLTVIERQPGWRFLNLTELWRYRELLWFLVWRDVKVRYKQTVLGAAWAVVQPLATMLVFTVFLGRMAGAASDMATYPLFVFTGLLAWTFFAGAISSSGQSVVANQSLVTKVYFPRLILPMSAVGVGLVDLVIGLGVLGVMMLCYGVAPGWGVLVLPVLTLLLVLAALGVGTLLSALTVAYRDFRHVVPFLVQLWMFATPAIYVQGTFSLGPTWEALLPLNPAQGLIANFRQAMLGGELDLYSAALSGSVGLVLLAAGCLYFRRVEKDFADII